MPPPVRCLCSELVVPVAVVEELPEPFSSLARVLGGSVIEIDPRRSQAVDEPGIDLLELTRQRDVLLLVRA